MARVLTIGTFDLLHYGHLRFLRTCWRMGTVTVGINSDKFVKKFKGQKPVLSERQRLWAMRELNYVDEAVISKDKGNSLVERLVPDYLVVGSDWARKDYLKQIGMTHDQLDDLGVTLVYVPYTGGISTSEIRGRL